MMESDQIFSQNALKSQWESAVSSCRAHLERGDLPYFVEYNTWDHLRDQLDQGCNDELIRREFTMFMPSLVKLRTFSDHWLQKAGPEIRSYPIWGLLNLLMKILQEERSAISHVLPMMREICNGLGLLGSYFAAAESFGTDLIECCIESSITLLQCLSDTIEFLRNDMPIRPSTSNRDDNLEWRPLENKFQSTLKRVQELSSRSEKISKITRRLDRMTVAGEEEKPSSSSLYEEPLPKIAIQAQRVQNRQCVIWPTFRTSRFFDRTDVIAKMESYFNQADSETSFLSLAIYGLGGVGKSTVALRYAERKLQQSELDMMFWVCSEKLVTIRQSFTNIALRLKLPDAKPGDHEENHALVLNWLQSTDSRWLIVFDNAEDIDMIRHHWPLASRGHAIITTRNPSFGFELADRGIEIINWNNDQGLKFLLQLLSTDIGDELKGDEIISAEQLSQKLRGHALAISTMAGLIHKRALSVTEFLTFYDQHPSEVHRISGNRSINALWDMSFKSLSPNSYSILAAMSFLEPDGIPQTIFETDSADKFPPSLRFCCDPLQFTEAIETLLTLSLIKRDRATRNFSLHRLVQSAFKSFMTLDQKRTAFTDASVLVARAFPRRDTELAMLYLMWDRCAHFLQHVINLKDCFREEHTADPEFTATPIYCDLNNMCQRYLLELHSHEELEDLVEVNTIAMNTLPKEDQAVGLWGSLTSHRGQVLVYLGKPQEGVKWLKKSYDIRSKDVPFSPVESTWAAENLSMGVATTNDFESAIKWYETAEAHYMSWANAQTDRERDLPSDSIRFHGTILFWAGQTDKARSVLMKAMKSVESEEPFIWAVAASVHFALGNLARRERSYDTAESHYLEAQNLWLKGDQMRSDPFNAAIMYRLGCTALEKGSVEGAIKHLRDALLVTEMRKTKLVAEHARVLFKLSEALEQNPRSNNSARQKRDEAESLLRRHYPNAGDPGKEITYDSLVCIEWR